MSLYDDERYTWRETYFVLIDDLRRRPRLDELRRELQPQFQTLKILDGSANPERRLRTLTVASYEDHSALEIVFRQGTGITAEIDALIRTIERSCSLKERHRLRSAKKWVAKLDVLHFEQTAGTAAFGVVKLPVLKFQSPRSDAEQREYFSAKRGTDRLDDRAAQRTGPFARRPQFRFDPDSYGNCLAGGSGDEYARELDQLEITPEDSGMFERVDPDTLLFVLQTLCRLTGGIAIDPASGVIIDN